ncbi:5-methylthioadenosine/S-adenosylhomocysteine deaminase [Halogeometricum rufum]|uniref:5-methylthioadenosine/S-adenosylhomocysteine deaminase n=1 Tax=Halogeometricum rufum TaxID=553469 RepID=A0A1I6I535_9EURY|nr:amidohydrolase family protein [Halogeometricum rufum]SFR61857.1 5-methylthioadenosine/S-adenosylhomocysteine deaminase [Halogeometricum rufum]
MSDIVIHDATVLTVDDRNRLYERGTVVVEDGRISDVRRTRDGDADGSADRVVDGAGTVVMPGLVNAHTHLELTPLLGAFSGLGVTEMLATMTALYGRLGDGDFDYLARAGYELAALNFLVGGVTTVNSMDVDPREGAETFGDAGLRGFFGPTITDLFWDVPVAEQFARAEAFVEEYHGAYDGRIRATICPHDDWSCTRDLWERVAELAESYPDVLVHTHLLELAESDAMARANGAADSLSLLDDVGLLDDRLVAAHFRVADDDDVRRTAAADASVVHCPSVFCYWNPDADARWTPVPALRRAGVDVGLGVDDHYWHDSYDLFGEARQTRLAAHLERGAGQFGSTELVRMLTIDGARALGVGDEIGSLEPGKRADLLVLDVEKPKFTPLTNVPAQVVNNATRADVETVVVDGEMLMRDGRVQTMDVEAVRERATAAVERFDAETEWDVGPGGADPPGAATLARQLPKRGPTRLLGRLAVQSLRDASPF